MLSVACPVVDFRIVRPSADLASRPLGRDGFERSLLGVLKYSLMNTEASLYLAVDVGASKTLLAAFSVTGKAAKQQRFPTAKNYQKFLQDLKHCLDSEFSDYQFTACCCAIPGKVDRKLGIGQSFGNLEWKNVPIKDDLKKILGPAVVFVENDANLAGLSEALLVHREYKKVLYLTISTGIGDGIIINGKIDADLADSEAGQMLVEHAGRVDKWEAFASGRALKLDYQKLAKDITDPAVWAKFSKAIAAGLNELLAVLQPDVVIIGGSVGAYYERFSDALSAELRSHPNKMVDVPPVIKARRPQEAVIYGCYDFTRQQLAQS